jgi:hypothetical protein
MPATVTVTGTTGPGFSLAAVAYTGITSFQVDTVNNVLNMVQGSFVLQAVNVAAAATVTATKSGSTWTLTIS